MRTKRVVNSRIAVRMIFAENVSDDAAHFLVGRLKFSPISPIA